MKRAFQVVAALLAAAGVLGNAQALLIHEHRHALAFSADGKTLLVPSETGLATYPVGSEAEPAFVADTVDAPAFSSFSVTERILYASGSSKREKLPKVPLGLLASNDGGATWRALALPGEADFPLLATGYFANAIYVLNAQPNSAMSSAGLYLSRDFGAAWQRAALGGLKGEIHGLSAHPREAGTVAVATGHGLYLSRDEGQRFAALDASEPVTAVAFDLQGQRIRYAHALRNEVVDLDLASGARRSIAVPGLKGDYITCLAQNPVDGRVFALGTRRKEVFVTRDAGKSWQKITDAMDD